MYLQMVIFLSSSYEKGMQIFYLTALQVKPVPQNTISEFVYK